MDGSEAAESLVVPTPRMKIWGSPMLNWVRVTPGALPATS